MLRVFAIIVLILFWTNSIASEKVLVGQVIDSQSGDALAAATVQIVGSSNGAFTDENGYFTLRGLVYPSVLKISFVGYQDLSVHLAKFSNDTLKVYLVEELESLNEVVVQSSRSTLKSSEKGLSEIKISGAEIKNIPAIAGEPDILKVMQLLPGVKRGSDGSSGFFVRGGGIGNNLICLDGVPLYNPTHLLGIFSSFNSDFIEEAQMQKAAFSSEFGSRLSSVTDIKTIQGLKDTWNYKLAIGAISSKALVSGPVGKKSTLYLGGRYSYLDQVSSIFDRNIPYTFYDINAKWITKFNDKTTFSTGYFRSFDNLYARSFGVKDIRSLQNTGAFNLNVGSDILNETFYAHLDHEFSKNLNSKLIVFNNYFDYSLNASLSKNTLNMGSSIRDYGFKNSWNSKNWKWGFEFINRNISPSSWLTEGDLGNFTGTGSKRDMLMNEAAIYAEYDWNISDRHHIETGLRVSGANSGSSTFINPEPRIRYRFSINELSNLHFSAGRSVQYLHLLSSSALLLPTDIWYPFTNGVKPSTNDALSLGFERSFLKNKFHLNIETYYNEFRNLAELKEGANLLFNENFEKELLSGKGLAYGAEFMLKYSGRRFNAWLSYTYSHSKRQFDGLNEGNWFYDRFDRRHDISFNGTYLINSRIKVNSTLIYSTGSRVTTPISYFFQPNLSFKGVDAYNGYGERNGTILAPNFRIDLDLSYDFKGDKFYQGEIHIGAYNLLNRTQPYRIAVETRGDGTTAYQQRGLFGFLPYFTYELKF